MIESGYYPMGAEHDPRAPWNQNDGNEIIDVDVCISTTISKNSKIASSDVIVTKEKCSEVNDEGGIDYFDDIEYEYSECNLVEDYKSSEYTVLELLNILKEYVHQDLKNNKSSLPKEYNLNKILQSLEGWSVDELEVIPE